MQFWTLPPVTMVRSTLRRLGVTRLLGAPQRARNRIRGAWYDFSRPSEVHVRVEGARATLRVGDRAEFIRAQSFREDRTILAALLRRASPGEAFWDVGASIGLYSALMSSKLGKAGEIVAFEPEPRSNARLRENLESNKSSAFRVIDAALSDSPGVMTLHFAGHFASGAHSLFGQGSGPDGASVDVEVARGDDLRERLGLRAPALIKVDVEGAEEEVLRGLSGTLAGPSCHTLLCEVHFTQLEARGHGEAPTRIESSLRAHGFRTRWLDPSHVLATK
jgi:FkbM family methyltransferase